MGKTTDLNMRIAKVLGWTLNEWATADNDQEVWENPDGVIDDRPDWSGDLNLMHELENGLSDDEACYYVELLDDINQCSTWLNIHATAAQKAEVWLKVKEA